MHCRPLKYVWHGARTTGGRDLTFSCSAWSSSSANNKGRYTALLKNRLLGQETIGCENQLAVLCIEATSMRRQRQSR